MSRQFRSRQFQFCVVPAANAFLSEAAAFACAYRWSEVSRIKRRQLSVAANQHLGCRVCLPAIEARWVAASLGRRRRPRCRFCQVRRNRSGWSRSGCGLHVPRRRRNVVTSAVKNRVADQPASPPAHKGDLVAFVECGEFLDGRTSSEIRTFHSVFVFAEKIHIGVVSDVFSDFVNYAAVIEPSPFVLRIGEHLIRLVLLV